MTGLEIETNRSSPAARKTGPRPTRKRVNFIQEADVSSDGSSDERPSLVDSSRAGETHGGGLNIDPERMGKICEKLKEPDPWPREFAEFIKHKQESIQQNLNEIKLKSAADKQAFEAELAPLLRTALAGVAADPEATPLSSTGPIHIPFLDAEGQPYHDGLVCLLRQSEMLIHAYDQLSDREPRVSRLQGVRASFERDKQVAVATLEAGRRVAQMDIERLLADKFQDVRPPHELTGDDLHKGRLLLSRGADHSMPGKQPLGWGNVARETERAVERLCFAGQGQARNH